MKVTVDKNKIVLDLETGDLDKLLHQETPTKCVYCKITTDLTKWKVEILTDSEGKRLWMYTCPECGRQVI